MRQLSEKLEYRPTTTAAGKLIDENQLRRLHVKFTYDIEIAKQNMTLFIFTHYQLHRELRNIALRKLGNLISLYRLRLFKSKEEGMSECAA